ncbi:MAG: hypothetical protein IT176_02935 [Acidobacteria bacterium]|nr:hypothetical protein [Acidobacteriota bacterium]
MRAPLMALVASFAAALASPPAAGQQVTREAVAGIDKLARLETTVACAGAITPVAIPAIKAMGFVSIVNLRLADEPGAEIERNRAAAEASGLRYVHVPFSGASPDPAAADRFLEAITAEGAEPAFIHCSGGNRAATMWLIKRMAVDGWDADRASAEAEALGQTSAALRRWAIEYATSRR